MPDPDPIDAIAYLRRWCERVPDDQPRAVNKILLVGVLAEVDRLRKLEALVRSILSQSDDDHCHLDWGRLYPAMAALAGMPEWKPRVLGREAMLANCARFVDCLLAGEHYETPSVTAEEAERLRAERDRLYRFAVTEPDLTRDEAAALEPGRTAADTRAIDVWNRAARLAAANAELVTLRRQRDRLMDWRRRAVEAWHLSHTGQRPGQLGHGEAELHGLLLAAWREIDDTGPDDAPTAGGGPAT